MKRQTVALVLRVLAAAAAGVGAHQWAESQQIGHVADLVLQAVTIGGAFLLRSPRDTPSVVTRAVRAHKARRRLRLVLLLVSLALAPHLARAQRASELLGPGAVFERVFTGITAATDSIVLQNRGQSQHVIVVTFPGAVATVSGLEVRIEAALECTDPSTECAAAQWFPISADVTSAPLLSATPLVYTIATAYGPFPYIRVTSKLPTPGAEPMTVDHVGNLVPIIPAVILTPDRIIL